jgi:hypothetical protein
MNMAENKDIKKRAYEISESSRKKAEIIHNNQIREMAEDIKFADDTLIGVKVERADILANFLYRIGYVKQPKGRWISHKDEVFCSACGYEASMDEVYYRSPYCPTCGAKMEGGAE